MLTDLVMLSGATGLIGAKVGQLLVQAGFRVVTVSRSAKNASLMCPFPAAHIGWDEISKFDLKSVSHVIHLAGEPVANWPWSAKRKKLIVSSRVDATHDFIEHFKHQNASPKSWTNASAIGFYGDRSETILNEIGEIRNPYKYEMVNDIVDGDRVYSFTNKNGIKYLLTFSRPDTHVVDVEYSIIDGRRIDTKSVANVGDPLTIFSTVFDALVKYVKENPEIEIISYSPAQNFEDDKRREKIYMEYMKKNFAIKKTWIEDGPQVMVKIK